MPPPSGADRGFRFVDERERWHGPFLRLTSGTFVDPTGFTFERDIVRHPGAVCIVPVEPDGETYLMVRQYRAPLDALVLEFPAGKLDVPGEKPETAAQRELEEEVGRSAGSLVHLGDFVNSPGFTDELTHCYLGTELRPVAQELQGVEEQHLEVVAVKIAHVWEMVASGELIDAKTIIAMTLAERHLASIS